MCFAFFLGFYHSNKYPNMILIFCLGMGGKDKGPATEIKAGAQTKDADAEYPVTYY